MNKADLIKVLAAKGDLSVVEASKVVNLIFNGFEKALTEGDRIEIRGFGSIVIREYNTYTGRNPKTGDKVEIKPKRLPYFKVAKELRDKVNIMLIGT
jgi:integration host factor subunit beta